MKNKIHKCKKYLSYFIVTIFLLLHINTNAQIGKYNEDLNWRTNRNQWLNTKVEISTNRPLGNMKQFFGSTINLNVYKTLFPIQKNTFVGISATYGLVINPKNFGVFNQDSNLKFRVSQFVGLNFLRVIKYFTLNSNTYLGLGANVHVSSYSKYFNKNCVDSIVSKQFYTSNSFDTKLVPISPVIEFRKNFGTRYSLGFNAQYIATPIVFKDANGGLFKGISNLQIGLFFGF
jgi:hypothetical protein